MMRTLCFLTVLAACWAAGLGAAQDAADTEGPKIILRASDVETPLLDLPDVGTETRRAAPGDGLGEVEFVVRTGEGRELFKEGVLLTRPGATEELRPIVRVAAPERSGGPPAPASPQGPGRYGISSKRTLEVEITAGALRLVSPSQVFWQAPAEPGWQRIVLELQSGMSHPEGARPAGDLPDDFRARRDVLAMVQYPYDPRGSGIVEGHPVGLYPDPASPQANSYVQRHKELYEPPRWFIKVTPETEHLKIGPRFTLGDFAPDAEGDGVRFIVVKPELVRYVEALSDAVRERWGDDARLRILRGYLSPYERTTLAAKGIRYTAFNRYQYGDAVAAIVDLDGSGTMGDLNGDGQVDHADALELLKVAEAVQRSEKLPGGIGMLERRHESSWPEGPCVSVDLRGIQTRW